MAELRRVAGTQLDPEVVEAFERMILEKGVAFSHTDEADFEAELAFEKRVAEYARAAAVVGRLATRRERAPEGARSQTTDADYGRHRVSFLSPSLRLTILEVVGPFDRTHDGVWTPLPNRTGVQIPSSVVSARHTLSSLAADRPTTPSDAQAPRHRLHLRLRGDRDGALRRRRPRRGPPARGRQRAQKAQAARRPVHPARHRPQEARAASTKSAAQVARYAAPASYARSCLCWLYAIRKPIFTNWSRAFAGSAGSRGRGRRRTWTLDEGGRARHPEPLVLAQAVDGIAVALQAASQHDRVLDRLVGALADGVGHRVRGVAEQAHAPAPHVLAAGRA